MVMVGVPAIEIGHHRHGRVANLRLTGQLGLGHVGHPDHAASPGTVQFAFRLGGELRPFHHHVGAATRHRQAQFARRLLHRIANARTDRMRHRDMRDNPIAEEAFLPRKAAVDKLIHNHEMPRRQFRLQAADRRQRQNIGHAGPLQRVDIGAVIQMRRRDRMPAAMPGQEHATHPGQPPEQQLIRRRTPGGGDRTPGFILQPLDIVQAGAADNPDHRLNHVRHLLTSR